MQRLTEEQLEKYHRDGYALYNHQLFDASTLQELTDVFEEHLSNKGSKLSDELDTPHFRDPRLLKYLLHNSVLDLVESVIGPNIGLWASHFICKDPFHGRATPWHEDSTYWEGRTDRMDKIVTVWLAIDDSTQENGCMRVIPGTHLNGGFSDYESVDTSQNTFGTQIVNVDESKAVYFELKRGECSLHDARIVHGAKANTSPYRRCGYTMRYISTEIKVIPERNPGHKLWLARGKDVAGNSYVNA